MTMDLPRTLPMPSRLGSQPRKDSGAPTQGFLSLSRLKRGIRCPQHHCCKTKGVVHICIKQKMKKTSRQRELGCCSQETSTSRASQACILLLAVVARTKFRG